VPGAKQYKPVVQAIEAFIALHLEFIALKIVTGAGSLSSGAAMRVE
jgi:hypothetical protein